MNTDVDGSAMLILGIKEAVYLTSILCLDDSILSKSILKKSQEVIDYEVERLKDEINKTT